jgi:hypothetical protein
MELCNCTMLCRCWLGPAKPDQGWCSGAFVFDIRDGNADGVRLGGRKVVLAAEWPADFWSGNGKARIYVDDAATGDQRRELEAIFSGKKGGALGAVMGGAITKWLPAQVLKIEVQGGDSPSVVVGNVGQVKLQPLKDQAGRPTVLQGAAAQAAFQIASMSLASSKGSRWSDPEMRPWQGDSGNVMTFDWSA